MPTKRCFTMIELLAVIVIILVLAGILIGGIGYATKKADVAKTQSRLMQLEVGLDAFRTEYGFYPPADADSTIDFQYDNAKKTLNIVIGGKSYPFVKRGTTRPLMEIGVLGEWSDSWGNSFKYRCSGDSGRNKNSYDLWSEGPDGSSDTDDDIKNWQ